MANLCCLIRILCMGDTRSHRDLIVWQKAIRLSGLINDLTKRLPSEERFGLAAQIRRSARSVHANIAEGQGRETTKDFLHFLAVANGSLQETDSHLAEAVACGWVSADSVKPAVELIGQIRTMLIALRNRLKTTTQKTES